MKKVLVVLGGMSREHDISLMTGRAVIANLPTAGYEPIPAFIGRDGRFCFPPAEGIDVASEPAGPWFALPEAMSTIRDFSPACVFIALHGTFGEDGRIQSLFDLMDLPYVGADSIGSAVCIDKWATKATYLAAGVPTPSAVMLQGHQLEDSAEMDRVKQEIGFPMVVKATREGSSFGISIVKSPDLFDAALKEVRKCSRIVLFEKYVLGREFAVPVIEDHESGDLRALPAVEIIVKQSVFYDYSAKYSPNGAEKICPAQISKNLADRMGATAVVAHRALMLKGYSRTDFIVTGDDALWALETNTLPGLTEFSLLPKSAAAVGISYARLLSILVSGAIQNHTFF